MSETRVIKRYANRKLYDTQHSRYVTLDQISEMIRNGDDVKIVDNKTKEDLTSVTLAQIIFEEEKKQPSFLSLQTMRHLIQNGGESLTSLVSQAQRRMTSILPRRAHESGPDHAADPPRADEPDAHDEPESDPDTAMGKRGRDGLTSMREFREWVQQTQHTVEEWQRRVRDTVEGISHFSGIQKDVKGLAARIAELEAKLRSLAHGEPARHETPTVKPNSQPDGHQAAAPTTPDTPPASPDAPPANPDSSPPNPPDGEPS